MIDIQGVYTSTIHMYTYIIVYICVWVVEAQPGIPPPELIAAPEIRSYIYIYIIVYDLHEVCQDRSRY